jgi:hypothetical protein
MRECRNAPAAERNKRPILEVLQGVLPERGLVLEIASGTGQHIVHFAKGLPHLKWQPSDPDREARSSIAAHLAVERLANVRPPLDLDVHSNPWPIEKAEAIVCINMIHISPWTATVELINGAQRILPEQGILFLYGPFLRADRETAPSNEAFDADLRQRNPEWGLRELGAVSSLAGQCGLSLVKVVEMPANNISVAFRKSGEPQVSDA